MLHAARRPLRFLPIALSTMALAAACATSASSYQPFGTAFPREDAVLLQRIEHARAAASPREAVARWRQVLERFPDGERDCQDAIDLRYYRGACFELARALYLCGERDEGDRWLRLQLDDDPAGR